MSDDKETTPVGEVLDPPPAAVSTEASVVEGTTSPPSEANTEMDTKPSASEPPRTGLKRDDDDDEKDIRSASQPPPATGAPAAATPDRDSKAAIRREMRALPTPITPGAVAVLPGGAAAPAASAPQPPSAASIKATMREERNARATSNSAAIRPGAVSVAPSSSTPAVSQFGKGAARPSQPVAPTSEGVAQPGAHASTAPEDKRRMAKMTSSEALAGSSTALRSSVLGGTTRIRPSRLHSKQTAAKGGQPPSGAEETQPDNATAGVAAAAASSSQPGAQASTVRDGRSKRDEVMGTTSGTSRSMPGSGLTKLDEARVPPESTTVAPIAPMEKDPDIYGQSPDRTSTTSGSYPAFQTLTDSKNKGWTEVTDSKNASDRKKEDEGSSKMGLLKGQDGVEDGMVTAMVIDEDELEAEYHAKMLRDVVAADVVDLEELKEQGRCWKMSVACLCLIGIILAIVLPLTKDDSSPPDPPTPSPTEQSPSDYLYDMFFPFSGSTLDDSSTPQYRAFNWLLNEDPAQLPIKETNDTILMERYAASVFYYSTNGDNWINRFSFLSNKSICEWVAPDNMYVGFFCEPGTNIALGLEMTGNNLNGTLPGELRMFSKLDTISFIEDGLRGTLPSELGDMTSLTTFQLSGQQLSGTIPESFSRLHFRIFNIIDNDFSGTLQSDLFTGSDILEVLAFAQNGFEGPLPALNRQSAIQVVFGYDNKFEGPIPSSYFQQGELQLLLLANNRLSGSIPEQIRALSNLAIFQGQRNEFTGTIPASISEIPFLQELNLRDNMLTGTLPSLLGRMKSLATVNLAGNRLSGSLPSELGDMQSLGFFDVSRNALTGLIPSSFAEFNALGALYVSGTSIDGLETAFCSQPSVMTILGADCLGDNSTSLCSCCSTCCRDGMDCQTNITQVCQVRGAVYESQSERGTSCDCVEDDTRLSCLDTCATCNLDGSVCLQSTDYGTAFNQSSGDPISFQNVLQYTVGRDEALTFSQETGNDVCELRVNGELCEFCGFSRCSSGLQGYEISCANIGGPSVSTCGDGQASAGYLEAFYIADPSLASGCIPVLSDYVTATGFVPS